jgi:sugar-specific transcriptional regulator TrmB
LINLCIALLILSSINIFSAEIVVTNNNNTGDGSLRKAVEELATDGDIITFDLAPGDEVIEITPEIDIDKSITIDGSNISGSGTCVTITVPTPGTSGYRVFYINDENANTSIMYLYII